MTLFRLLYFIFIFSITSILNSCSNIRDKEVINCDDLQFDPLYNHFFLENRKEPYTGLCERKDRNGTLLETINYTEGKVDGTLTRYYPDGKKKEEINYTMNLQDGENNHWDEDGNLILKAIFKRGEMDSILIDNR